MKNIQNFGTGSYPVGKIAEKAFCRSVFLTKWHCILSADINTLLQTVILAVLPTGYSCC